MYILYVQLYFNKSIMKSTIKPYETTSQTALRSSQNTSIQAIKQNLPTGKTQVPDEGKVCQNLDFPQPLGNQTGRSHTHTHTHTHAWPAASAVSSPIHLLQRCHPSPSGAVG